MEPRSAIANTLARYARIYDVGDVRTIGQCFTSDAEVTFGTGVQNGREAVTDELVRRRSLYGEGVTPWHVVSNVDVIELTDDRAVVSTFFTFWVFGDPAMTEQSFGYYDDVLQPEDDMWRIARRAVVSLGRR
jgi:hypothetical protein